MRTDFMYSLLISMIPAFLISLSFDYYFVYTQNMKALREGAESKITKSAETLRNPLWQYDFDFLQTYAEILTDDHSLSSVTIYDERNRKVAHSAKDFYPRNRHSVSWTSEQPVVLNGRSLGRLVMTFNNSEISLLTGRMIMSDILVILAVLCSVWTVTWVLINRYVLQPLRIMRDSFHRISEGDYSERVVLEKDNELASIAKEFNAMVHQVEMREMALRESEVKYRNLVESPSDIIFTTDTIGKLLFINENYHKWTSFDGRSLLGHPFSELFATAVNSAIETPVIESNDYLDALYEEQLLKKDGMAIPVEVKFSVQYDSNGVATGIIGIARDITNRKQAEEDLRKYEQMVASITDYMLLIDKRMIIQAVNNAYLEGTGKNRQELIGQKVETIYDEKNFTNDFLPYFETCLEGTMSVKDEIWLESDGCRPKYMVVTFYPIFEKDGSVSGVMIHQRDVTEQKKLEAMLHQSQKMEAIGTLAGGIAHDFNNIIGGIIGYAEMIELFDASFSPRIESRIQHVLKGAYRAKDLVEQILTFSRNSDPRKKPLNLGALVKDTMQFLRASIPSTIEILKMDNCRDAIVWADETSMHQILMNLCTNAAHAMQTTGGTLAVSLTIENVDASFAEQIHVEVLGPYVKLAVRDTGAGIDAQKIERIFEPFYTTKKTGEGTGMGLAVVHGIVKNLRGAITVDSTPGQGSTFSVYLPQFELNVQEAEEQVVRVDELQEGKGCILIVDDEEELAKFSEEILDHLGYEVVSKTSSIHARKIFMENPDRFDLVITDQTMPNMTGTDLARQFLEIRKDIPIVLCTGFSQANLENEARKIGITRFVKKPFGARQLVEIVKQELAARREVKAAEQIAGDS